MDMLFLRLPATATEAIQTVCFRQGHWQRLGSWAIDAGLDQQWQSLKDLPVVLITPVGMDVGIVLQATMKQRREAGADLVALAEDQVAEDYERLHWTLQSIDDQQVLARGINKSWLQGWRDRLQASGLNVRAAIPESSLFTQDHDTWLWLPAGDAAVYWQMELGQGAVVQRSDIAALMQAQLDRQPLLSSVRLRYPQGTSLPALPERIQSAPAPWQDWTDLLKTQNSGYWLRHPQNWLMGDMANKAASGGSSRWGWVALLAITAVLELTRFSQAFLLLKAKEVGVETTWVPAFLILMSAVYGITAYPCGSALPDVSNLNYRPGIAIANSATVPIGAGGKV